MPKVPDITGEIYGYLTVVNLSHRNSRGVNHWNCLCSCGGKAVVAQTSLTRGYTKSCGCLRREVTRQASTKHGKRHSNEYGSWVGAKKRCFNKNEPAYHWYGARGITMTSEWVNDFQAFYDHMGLKPVGTSLDRINPDGNYEPGNVRWATIQQQANNKSATVTFIHKGELLTVSQISRKESISLPTLRRRLKEGLSLEKALVYGYDLKKRQKAVHSLKTLDTFLSSNTDSQVTQ